MDTPQGIHLIASEIEKITDEPPGEIIEEAVLTPEDWKEYDIQIDRVRQAMLAPDTGRIIVNNIL